MPIGSALLRLLRRRRARRLRPIPPGTTRRRMLPSTERLDARRLPSTVTLLSATTVDSQGVTLSYEVSPGDDLPQTVGVYRSASPTLDATAMPVGVPLALPSVDAEGLPANSPGVHRVTIQIPGGLPITPARPHVLVVTDPGSATAGQPGTVASFRKASIAIVTHGGIQHSAWKKNGPPWALKMARSLLAEGYDEAIPYNWVSQSRTPGMAARQGPKVAEEVRRAVASLPFGEPVDLHFIGHSEGAVVNTIAIVHVGRMSNPGIRAGYLEDTLLDPHAANPDFPGRQYSTSGPLGWIAKLAIDSYQSKARDPLVFVPRAVDSAKVFYQQTPADQDHGTNAGIYNIWGQVPVKGDADYYNLTQAGIVHSGKQGVANWYQNNVVPSLGKGAPGLAATTLITTGENPLIDGRRATYSGEAQPGATVRLTAGKGRDPLHLVAKTVVEGDGTWTATTRPLAPGRYRVLAASKPARWSYDSRQAIPTAPLGPLEIGRR